jgi:hypothetical protein
MQINEVLLLKQPKKDKEKGREVRKERAQFTEKVVHEMITFILQMTGELPRVKMMQTPPCPITPQPRPHQHNPPHVRHSL